MHDLLDQAVFNQYKHVPFSSSIFSYQDRYPRSTYERLFRKEYGYNNKLHRDDREHAKSRGLVVNKEVHI